jgi:hypothetical protein
MSIHKLAAICAATLLLSVSPGAAQQVTTVTGTQTTGSGSNAKLNCAEVRLPRQGTITEASTRNTSGFWINRGPVLQGNFPQAAQAVGYTLRANDPHYICPNPASGGGTSSVTVTIRY